MKIDNLKSKEDINYLISLYKEKSFEKGLIISNKLIKKHPNSPDMFFLNGVINLALNNFLDSIKSFSKAINENNNFLDAINNKGVALYHLGKFKDALIEFEKVLKIKPKDPISLNNIGNCFNSMKKFDKAIDYYNNSLKFDQNFILPILNIIKILTFYDTKINLNKYISINNKIRSLNLDLNINKFISDEKITSFFIEYSKIIPDEIINIDFKTTEIFRRDKNLKCARHFEIFNKFNVIPEFCFGCYKVQIEPENILDLIKLYFVFDKIKLPSNNIRKCAIETRENVSGSYKGFIYSSNIHEANEIYNIVSLLLKKATNKQIAIKIKRGCSEFAASYPEYTEVDPDSDKFMNYNLNWKAKENIIDENKTFKNKTFHSTLSGISLNDILIIKNWIVYAKNIGDPSCKYIYNNNLNSNFVERQLGKQLVKRKNEFLKLRKN